MRYLISAAILGSLLAGCGGQSEVVKREPASDSGFPLVSIAPTKAASKKRPQPMTYSSTCAEDFPTVFVVGDGTSSPKTGPRFIADITVYNDGDRVRSVIANVRWLLVGGEKVLSKPLVKDVRAGGSTTFGFTMPATLDQLQRMGAHRPGDKLCTVFVAGD